MGYMVCSMCIEIGAVSRLGTTRLLGDTEDVIIWISRHTLELKTCHLRNQDGSVTRKPSSIQQACIFSSSLLTTYAKLKKGISIKPTEKCILQRSQFTNTSYSEQISHSTMTCISNKVRILCEYSSRNNHLRLLPLRSSLCNFFIGNSHR